MTSPNRKRRDDRREKRRSPKRRRSSRSKSPIKSKKLLEEAEMFAIYDAKVNNITNFGAFAEVLFIL